MKEVIIQMIAGAVASVGFAIYFNARKKYLPFTVLGSIICWGMYLLLTEFGTGVFFASLAASAATTVFAEITARIKKAPVTIFLVPSLLVLAPGASLYYTFSYAVLKEWELSNRYGNLTLQCAIGMAVGMSFVWAMTNMIRRIISGQKVN